MYSELQILPTPAYPENLLPSLRDIQFVCPLCRGKLNILEDGYQCAACNKKYLLHAGIPDFRVFPDPYLDFQEDFERTEIVLSGLEKYNLEKLLEYYWSFSDITPENLRPKFVRSALMGEERAKRTLEILDDKILIKNIKATRILEIGSGTGNFLELAVGRFDQVIGIDIAMRWLHMSRRRFIDKDLPIPPLVCCCAEFLPFADESFDIVAVSSTLEFVKDKAQVLSEAARVLLGDGALYLNTVNRFGLTRDPYSYLWGVGFLPRKWQAKYVYWRSKAIYKIQTLSYNEINCLTGRVFANREFVLPDVSPAAIKHFSMLTQLQIYFYLFLKKFSVFSHLLKHMGPGWDVILRRK